MQPSLFDPPAFVPDDLPERMAAKMALSPESDCWAWTGVRGSDGYGKVRWKGRTVSIHRLTYELLVGVIPDGLEIDHLCRVRYCANPSHMETVTHRENIRRSFGLTTEGECRHGHKLAVVGVRPSGQCAECSREARRRYVAKRAA